MLTKRVSYCSKDVKCLNKSSGTEIQVKVCQISLLTNKSLSMVFSKGWLPWVSVLMDTQGNLVHPKHRFFVVDFLPDIMI